MLGKLLGKKDKFYLELSEDEIAAIPEPSATPAPKAKKAEKAESKASTAPAPAAPSSNKASSDGSQKVATPQAMSDPLELIRTALAASANQPAPAEPEPEATFDYRAPVAKASRRRPGPSMSPFKTMAKDMKKTTAGF